jgi:hypothetical protein
LLNEHNNKALLDTSIERELKRMARQGMSNKDQTREQIEKHDKRNDIELGSEFQVGNTKSQSQKKSGRQVNKK